MSRSEHCVLACFLLVRSLALLHVQILTHEKFLNFKTLLEQSSSLRSELDVVKQVLKERVQECETLRTRHNILERACQEAGVCVEEQERYLAAANPFWI